jgi:hypothetical protein
MPDYQDYPGHLDFRIAAVSPVPFRVSRNLRICRNTRANMAGVSRPVCVFCWLG